MIEAPLQRTAMHKRKSGTLRTPDLLAKWPVIGVIMIVLGSLIFAVFAYNLSIQSPMVQWDLTVANRMHTAALQSPVWIKDLMYAGDYIGLQGYIVIGVLLGGYFLYHRFWKELLMVAVGCMGQGAFWLLLANLFNRHRPEFDTPFGSALHYPSFPSGHTMSGLIGFGLLAYILVPKIPAVFGKAMMVIFSLLMMAFIGFSRFFLGAHYLTDVVAGYAAGLFWAGLVFTVIELLFAKGGNQDVKEKQTYSSQINR